MIIPDLNLLLYAHREDEVHYEASSQWWQSLLDGDESVGVPWSVATGFIRIATLRGLPIPPMSSQQAMDVVEHWLAYDHVQAVDPGPQHLTILRSLLEEVGSYGNLVPDAHIAAIAIEHDAEVHTNDRGFRCFPGLRWRNPLAEVV